MADGSTDGARQQHGGIGQPAAHNQPNGTIDAAATLRAAGLFQPDWYLAAYPDVAAAQVDPLAHYVAMGWRQGRRPNPYFDAAWYVELNPDVRQSGAMPLLHYALRGEAEGRRPAPFFDAVWYRQSHRLPRNVCALGHYLALRTTGQVSPLPEFDAGWYLRSYPDVAAAGMDPFEHYLHQGFKEDRNPSAEFDTRFYRRRYLAEAPEQNPLLHYIFNRHRGSFHPRRPDGEASIAASLRANARPGPAFEDVRPLPASATRRAMVLAYYLPQFHAIPENDRWWGNGFTEWVSISRGLPRFEGHYQPRVPRDLGHYDLMAPGVMRRQIDMARGAGLSGFVFYFYWFNGERLLERPLEAMLADASLDFPFCLMWANENWTRRWDGSEDEVLISQDYRREDEAAMAACFARHFADPRYIRLQGRPVLMMYRPRLVPDAARTVARWRALFRDLHGEDPIFVMSQSFNETDPRVFGMDGAIEFPPHKLVGGLDIQNPGLSYLDDGFTAQVFAYDDVAAASLAEPAPDFPLIKTAVPSWDNDARRQGAGLVIHGSTPAGYQAWMAALVERAQQHRFFGEAIVCVNAWNEWAEGAYLEPDQHFGGAYLNATGRAVAGLLPAGDTAQILLVGHDAFPAGAQRLLLEVGRQMQRAHGLRVAFLLLGGGKLLADYQAVAPTMLAETARERQEAIARFRAEGFRSAVVNTSAAAELVPPMAAAGFDVTLMVHELPRILAERGWEDAARQAAAIARRVVFPAELVRGRFLTIAPDAASRAEVLPQGLYSPAAYSADARSRGRAELGIEPDGLLAIGVGYADLRKGFDLFLHAWRALRRQHQQAHALWLGEIDPALRAQLDSEIEAAVATGCFHFAGQWSKDVAGWLSAADVFLLTSREDPMPSVVMEAMSAGLPSVAFAATGGMPELLLAHAAGEVVSLGDVDSMAQAAIRLAAETDRTRLAAVAAMHFSFDAYVAALLRIARPSTLSVSVVVPSYNYGRYMRQRLSSVFAQTHPVEEVIVLDDASTDDSVAAARDAALDWNRIARIEVAAGNSGSVFAQWRRAARMACGDYLWIAEADDDCDPRLLETLAAAVARAPDAVLAFTDSRSIDADGGPVWADYKAYYAQDGADTLAEDVVMPAGDFLRSCLADRNLILNVSAVLWRRDALLAALDRCGDELSDYRMAGDWRLYVEALSQGHGSVAYVAAPLNVHRRHGGSATHSMDAAAHVAEIARVHDAIATRCRGGAALRARQSAYRASVAAQLGLQPVPAPRRARRGEKALQRA